MQAGVRRLADYDRGALATGPPVAFVLNDDGAVHGADVTSLITTVPLAPRVLLTAQQALDPDRSGIPDSARHTLSRSNR
ncbi:hypothetical protein [Streptacidiphilus pinicola]|uniref:hypothetical protein n=1 Tax=Streptacidiphilus pinicola TaxID=2219663 RepID=UPI0010579CBE|nr:hypothetical protein [Streptacidiphilus pinicola]